MEIITLTLKAIHGINDLLKAREEVVWNKEQCKRLLERLQALISPLEKIKTKADPSQQPLVTTIVQTIERASEFVQEFRQKKSIFKWLKRKDYKDDFQSLHEQVSQHVNDLNLGETVLIGEELHIAIKNAEKADENHLHELLEGIADQIEENHHEQTDMIRAMREGFGEEFKTVKSILAKLDAVNKEYRRCNEIPKEEISLDEMLGRGSFGVVRKGTWSHLQVAVKVFHPGMVTHRIVSMARKEAQVMQTLQHGNVVNFYGLCTEFPILMIVMELAECSLDKCIYNKSFDLPIPARYNILLGIVAGLDFIHGKGVLHRDIKSFNVLVKIRGNFDPPNFKLTDFGLAHDTGANISSSLRSLTIGGGRKGTQGWLAPEADTSDVGYRFTRAADIYSLAILFYELLTRHLPYEGKTEREILRMLDRQQRPNTLFPVENGVAKEAVALMHACWAEDPIDRPSAAAVWKAVKALCASHPYHDKTPPSPPPPPNMEEMMREVEEAKAAVARDKARAEEEAVQRQREFEEERKKWEDERKNEERRREAEVKAEAERKQREADAKAEAERKQRLVEAKVEAERKRNEAAEAERQRREASEKDGRKGKKLIRSDTDIKTAVNAWCDNKRTAEAKYGHISQWDTSKVTSMKELFEDKKDFNEDISNWNVSAVTTMNCTFRNAAAFNQPLDKWEGKVCNVTDMRFMFEGAAAFNQPLEKWNVSAVTNMGYMFNGAASFNQPLDKWEGKVRKVTNMRGMFQNAASFNRSLEKWNVSAVTDMSYMFNGAASFNQSLEMWEGKVRKVTDMEGMFQNAASFDQPLERWNVSAVTNMRGMFSGAGMSFKPKWYYGTCVIS